MFTNKIIQKQKAVSLDVLKKFKVLDNRAIIAGGAARDWYLNTPASDIDIFFHFDTGNISREASTNQTLKLLEILLNVTGIKILGYSAGKESVETFENYLNNPDIQNVYEVEIEGITFQFINLVSRGVDVGNFGYNLCQAWTDTVTISYTKSFKVGIEKKVLIETGPLYGNPEKFKQKMIDKFPDYSYIEKNISFKP